MKVSKRQLRKIIKEEKRRILVEQSAPFTTAEFSVIIDAATFGPEDEGGEADGAPWGFTDANDLWNQLTGYLEKFRYTIQTGRAAGTDVEIEVEVQLENTI